MTMGKRGTKGEKQLNMIGQKFERLLVLKYDEGVSKLKGCDCYLCRCDCDTEKVISGRNLRDSRTKSCGCLNREKATERCRKLGNLQGENHSSYLHGFKFKHKVFREVIRVRDKVCQICGKTKEENGEELTAHHLDGDDYNHDMKNGVALCRGCHSMVTRGRNVWRPSYERTLGARTA